MCFIFESRANHIFVSFIFYAPLKLFNFIELTFLFHNIIILLCFYNRIEFIKASFINFMLVRENVGGRSTYKYQILCYYYVRVTFFFKGIPYVNLNNDYN